MGLCGLVVGVWCVVWCVIWCGRMCSVAGASAGLGAGHCVGADGVACAATVCSVADFVSVGFVLSVADAADVS